VRIWKEIRYEIEDVDAAYIAGLLDGEGYIAVVRHTRTNNGVTYAACVRVDMTDRAPIDFLANICGVSVKGRQLKSSKVAYRCTIGSNRAGALLEKILPHLRVKRQQALTVLRLIELKREERKHRNKPIGERSYFHVRAGRMVTQKVYGHSDEYRSQTRQLYLECRALNSGPNYICATGKPAVEIITPDSV
jgi:hypothetical protein